MSDIRQIPLFPDQPQSPEDINRHTRLQDTIALFLKHLAQEDKSNHTITAFRSDLNLLGENTGADTPIGQYTTTNLNQFLDWLENGRGVPCSRKSYARRVTTLKVYFKWLHTIEAIPHDPAKAILQRSGPAPLSYALKPVEITQAIIAARQMQKGDKPDYRPEMLFRLLLDTGIKKSEAARLTMQDIDRLNPQHPFLMIRYKVRNIYKERKIDLDPDWLKLLDLYREQYQPKDTIFNCTARNLEYILTDIGEQADIGTKLSFEMMRWSCAVRDYRAGLDDQLIREKMGLSEASWHETSKKIKRLAESQMDNET
jgi:site-specific recombinase XerD